MQVLVKLEPVGQSTKHEDEYRQAEQQETGHYAGSVPNLTSDRRDKVIPRQALGRTGMSVEPVIDSEKMANLHFLGALAEINESQCCEAWRTTRDESAVGLMTIKETGLEKIAR